MTGLWLVSYIILWLLVIGLCLIIIGLLQQLGMLQHQLDQHPLAPVAEKKILHPSLEEDGPTVGSVVPELTADSVNGFGSIILSPLFPEGYRLLMFLSPLCESCQHIVEPLNRLIKDEAIIGKVIAIMRADEQACQAFISVFPLNFPILCDSKRTLTMNFNVHHAPFGLLYNPQGILVSKGGIKNREDLLNLLRIEVQPQLLSL